MNLEAQFGELRSFLEKKPSSRTFDLILQLLEAGAKTNEAKVRAEWLPYAAQRLERWPRGTPSGIHLFEGSTLSVIRWARTRWRSFCRRQGSSS